MEQQDAWDSFYRLNDRPWRGSSDLEDISFPEGTKVLEIGCGNGKTSSSLRRMGLDVISMDFSSEAIAMCRRDDPEGEYVKADIRELPFDDDSFDGALAFHVLEHLDGEGLKKAKDEILRVLKNGSSLYVKVFSKDDMRSMKGTMIDDSTVIRGNGIRYHYFTEDSIKECFSELECIDVHTVNEKTRFNTVRSRIECHFIVRK